MAMCFNNRTERVVDDLKETIGKGDKVAIASTIFSIYAFQALKEQLQGIDELRFLFVNPTFDVPEKARRETREYYIPARGREQSLYGTEFEVRLRNELTQKAIARECADWIRAKVKFRTYVTEGVITTSFLSVNDTLSYMPMSEFTTVGLGVERGNAMMNWIVRQDASATRQMLEMFESIWNDKEKVHDVTKEVLDWITAAYRENSPDLVYHATLNAIFKSFLNDANADALPNDAVGFKQSKIWNMLYDFQKDAALSIIHKLETFNGCILADSVGLGKTFTALAVIKYYEKRNKNVLVLCPKKLTNNWNTYRANYRNNPLVEDRFSYQVLFHTDLSRTHGTSNGIDLSMINWENYDLVVIDESHNFRNGGHEEEDEFGNVQMNRYSLLMENVIRRGVKTKVLMLSATPVNNRFSDLRNQLELAYEGDSSQLDALLESTGSVKEAFRQAQAAFNDWSKREPPERTMDALLSELSADFFTILDAVTIARSRKHIRAYYDMNAIGRFPERLPPQKLTPEFTDLDDAPTYEQIYATLEKLNLFAYVPTNYIHPSKEAVYAGKQGLEDVDGLDEVDEEADDPSKKNLTQLGREQGIRKLMGVGLLKRLESSIFAFTSTLDAVLGFMQEIVDQIDAYEKHPVRTGDGAYVGRKIPILIADMNWMEYRAYIRQDIALLKDLQSRLAAITPEHDLKLRALVDVIREKLEHPLNPGNRKLLVFSAFTDTAGYLYKNLSTVLLEKHGIHSGLVTGDAHGSKSTLPHGSSDFNDVLMCFSPRSKDKARLFAHRRDPGEIDVLFASDCVSEGQNLQDCDMVVNYDIHWNPCRIIQRYGRVDRIGSTNGHIQLVNFWPNVSLDRYIKVRDRVETRMKSLILASTGDENPLALNDPELEFRKKQLERLRDEPVDIEDTRSGIPFADLGLSEYQQDLMAYVRKHPGQLERLPSGINAVVASRRDLPPGVIFVLKNVNDGLKDKSANRLHPFYLVYVGADGRVVAGHKDPKAVLDDFRLLAKGRDEYDPALIDAFNRETKDGKDMRRCSELLGQAVASLVGQQQQANLDSLVSGKETTSALENKIEGLDDFELVTFLVVR